MPLDYAAIGGRLQARRKELGITQEDAAERAGITVVYLSKIENGRVHPTLDLLATSVMVDTFGTGKLSDSRLVEIIRDNFDLRPAGIIKMLDLRRPIYRQTAAYGHFGRNTLNLPWEQTDKVAILKQYLI